MAFLLPLGYLIRLLRQRGAERMHIPSRHRSALSKWAPGFYTHALVPTSDPVLRLAMYSCVTRDIEITVLPEFMPERSDADRGQWFWAYTVEIANQGETSVQVTHRHWRITDANGQLEEVRGPGIVGEQPVLKPGEIFRYTSGCPLTTPSGFMVGTYRIVEEGGSIFEAAIPMFSLDQPAAKRVLN